MKLRFSICCGTLLIVAVSCSRSLSERSYNEYLNQRMARYCTNDIHAAEESLYSDLRTLSDWESNNVHGDHFRIDFSGSEALDHEGLFLIYRKMHETDKMKKEFELSVRLINESRRHRGFGPEPPIGDDEFARHLEIRDRRLNVRWQTNR